MSLAKPPILITYRWDTAKFINISWHVTLNLHLIGSHLIADCFNNENEYSSPKNVNMCHGN